MGWDNTDKLTSPDKRFEVDGANIARDLIRKEGKSEEWDKHRVQLVWDTIALHSSPSIASYKEAEVDVTHRGILSDFLGPDMSSGQLTWEEWNAVVEEYPRSGFKEGVREIMCGLCRNKPETTYDNFVAGFGERFVDGYSSAGKQVVDMIETMTLP